MTPIVESALGYAGLGWKVFPVWWPRGSACACPEGSACSRPAKHPLAALAPRGLLDATTDENVIREWWRRFPEANVAIACGAESGLWVLDVDGQKGGWVTLESLEARYGPLPYTMRARSGSGEGGHRLFAHPNGGTRISSTTTKLGAGLDVRGDGGYIVAPPSLHASGRRYAWEDEDEARLEPAPAWLLDLVVAKERTPAEHAPVPELPLLDVVKIAERRLAGALQKVTAGSSRHNTWVETAALLRDDLVPREIAGLLVPRFKRACDARTGDRVVPEDELRKVLSDVYASPRREPSPTAAAALAAAAEPAPALWLSTADVLARLKGASAVRLATGFPTLDRITRGGIPAGRLLVFVGRPGSGKTGFALSLAAGMAERGEVTVFTYLADEGLDAGAVRLAQRLGADRARLEAGDAEALAAAIAGAPPVERVVHLDPDLPGASLGALFAKVDETANGRTPLLVVDSAQVVRPGTPAKKDELRLTVKDVADHLKAGARKRAAVALLVSQMARVGYRAKAAEGQADPLATASESSAIEYQADVQIALEPAGSDRIKAVVTKNRLGEKDVVFFLALDRDRATYREIDGEELHDEQAEAATLKVRVQTSRDADKAVALLKKNPDGLTARQIREAVQLSGSRVKAAIEELQRLDRLVGEEPSGRGGGWRWRLVQKVVR